MKTITVTALTAIISLSLDPKLGDSELSMIYFPVWQ